MAISAFTLISWAESRWPLRRPVEPKPRRLGRNLAMAVITAAIE